MSFDLRGRPPSPAEYDQVIEAGDVPDSLVDEMLASDEFLDQVERWHAEIIWPNISRLSLQAAPLGAVRPAREPEDNWDEDGAWEDIGRAQNGGHRDISGDVLARSDEETRNDYYVAFEAPPTGITLRGGRHALPAHYCDMGSRPEAQYPPSTVDFDDPANQYTVSADESGDYQAHDETYYDKDGVVRPLQYPTHCPNYCVQDELAAHDSDVKGACRGADPNNDNAKPDTQYPHRDDDGDGNHDCYDDMDAPDDRAPGVDSHPLDPRGMRCADGYSRVINACDFRVEFETSPDSQENDGLRIGKGKKPRWQPSSSWKSSYNTMRDGWVLQEHYWSNGVELRTCAVEAQQRKIGTTGIPCDEVRSNRGFSNLDPSCGCGPMGVLCQPSQTDYQTSDETRTENRLRTAIEQEPMQIIRSVVDNDEDYLSILDTKRSFVNGPLLLAWSEQADVLRGQGDLRVTPPIESHSEWDDLIAEHDGDWGEISELDEWMVYQRGERHSGILTTLEFLARFPTARARVAQFRRAFVCSSEFDYAPEPDPTDTNPDISRRTGCASCHMRLERDGMWFARYPDRTGLYLHPSEYPKVHETCKYCVDNGQMYLCDEGGNHPLRDEPSTSGLREICDTYYSSVQGEKASDWAGHLVASIYRDPELDPRMTAGPSAMVEAEPVEYLEICAAETAWKRLVRRPAQDEEIQRIAEEFAPARNYRQLVRAVVTSDAYRASPQHNEAP
jgi:hypothetical protein